MTEPNNVSALDERDRALLDLASAVREQGYQFTTVTPATQARVNDRPDYKGTQDLRGMFGWSRPFPAQSLPAKLWDQMLQAEVLVASGQEWRSTVRFSTLNENIYVHSAYPTIETDAVFFGPDSVRFVNSLASLMGKRTEPVKRALDIGCGAGPGAISIARAYPDAQVIATDINVTALRFTRINALLAGASSIETCISDMLDDVAGEFDLIVANPPYLVDPQERSYRDGGGELGAQLSFRIIEAGVPRLAPSGSLMLYTGIAMVDGRDPFADTVNELLDGAGFCVDYREIDPDVFGEELSSEVYRNTERIAAVVLTITRALKT